MRITQTMLSRMGLSQLDVARGRLARLQEQAATGKRINRPSDDPVDYRAVRNIRDALSQVERFQRSIDLARTRIRTTENAISDSMDVLSQAKVAALAARNDTTGDADRAARRQEVETLFSSLLDHANSVAPGGGYVFAGTASDTAPFVQTGSFVAGSPAPTVAFAAENSDLEVEIDEGVYMEVTLDGERVFQGGTDVFQTLGTLWTAIDQDDEAAMDTAIADLDAAMQQLRVEQSRIGNEEAKADAREPQLALRVEELTSQLSFVEDADAYEVYSELVAQETALQSSLQVSSRLLGPTLLEFL